MCFGPRIFFKLWMIFEPWIFFDPEISFESEHPLQSREPLSTITRSECDGRYLLCHSVPDFEQLPTMIDVQELRKEYGGFVAVEGSSFSIDAKLLAAAGLAPCRPSPG